MCVWGFCAIAESHRRADDENGRDDSECVHRQGEGQRGAGQPAEGVQVSGRHGGQVLRQLCAGDDAGGELFFEESLW